MHTKAREFMEIAGETYIKPPNGMTTEEAVRYLEHGREMETFINSLRDSGTRICNYPEQKKREHAMIAAFNEMDKWARIILAKLEG